MGKQMPVLLVFMYLQSCIDLVSVQYILSLYPRKCLRSLNVFYEGLMKKENLWECIPETLSAGTCPEVGSRSGKREGPSGGGSALESSLKSGGKGVVKQQSQFPVAFWPRGPQEEALSFLLPFLFFPLFSD